MPTPVVEAPYSPGRFQAVTQAGQACVNDLQTGLTWANPAYAAGSAPTYSMVGDGRAQDVQVYIHQTNLQGWCGAHDWRLPNLDELSALRISTMRAPTPVFAVDCSLWVDTGQSWTPAAGGASQPVWSTSSQYWASTAGPATSGPSEWQFVVPFCDGYTGWTTMHIHNLLAARLVRP
jgi:hypothetical protein